MEHPEVEIGGSRRSGDAGCGRGRVEREGRRESDIRPLVVPPNSKSSARARHLATSGPP
jgi:hypothetical protein